jgi:hypothetical protein
VEGRPKGHGGPPGFGRRASRRQDERQAGDRGAEQAAARENVE